MVRLHPGSFNGLYVFRPHKQGLPPTGKEDEGSLR